MINPWQRMVAAFHRGTGQPEGQEPALRDLELRAKLIMEEAVETVAAMGYAAHGGFSEPYRPDDFQPDDIFKTFKQFNKPDFAEAIDGLCDLIYVTLGSAVAWGVDLDPFFSEVQRANMEKLQGPKRADGKQLKPEGWRPPDIEGVLAQARERATQWKRESRAFEMNDHVNPS